MGRAEWQGEQEGCCPEASTEQTLITDHSPVCAGRPASYDVRPKNTGHSGWQASVAPKATLLCQGARSSLNGV